MVSGPTYRDSTVFLYDGVTSWLLRPPHWGDHCLAAPLQGSRPRLSDAACLACKGAHEGEFSVVCHCAILRPSQPRTLFTAQAWPGPPDRLCPPASRVPVWGMTWLPSASWRGEVRACIQEGSVGTSGSVGCLQAGQRGPSTPTSGSRRAGPPQHAC